MSSKIKNLLVSLVALLFICCSSPSPQKDEYQESLDELDRLLEQQEEQTKKNIEIVEEALTNLRKECSDLREYKAFLIDNWQKYKQHERDFLIQLNDRQRQLYSEWYISQKGDKLLKQRQYGKKLSSSLDKNQRSLFGFLYIKLREHDEWLTDFQKRSNEFQNRKNALLNYAKIMFDDPSMYENFKLSIENELAY
jgi:hypothetical protein